MENLTGLMIDKVVRGDLDLLEAKDRIRDFDFPPGVDREVELTELQAAVEALEQEKEESQSRCTCCSEPAGYCRQGNDQY